MIINCYFKGQIILNSIFEYSIGGGSLEVGLGFVCVLGVSSDVCLDYDILLEVNLVNCFLDSIGVIDSYFDSDGDICVEEMIFFFR